MKNYILLFLLPIIFYGCEKDTQNISRCDWFPFKMAMKYKKEVIGTNLPPYLSTEVTSRVSGDSVFYIGEAKFMVNDCSSGEVRLTYKGANKVIVFIKGLSGVKVVSSSIFHQVTQSRINGSYVSELKWTGNYYISLRLYFSPSIGITQMEEINEGTGKVDIKYTKL